MKTMLTTEQKKEKEYLAARADFFRMVKESDDYEAMKEAEKKMKKTQKNFQKPIDKNNKV